MSRAQRGSPNFLTRPLVYKGVQVPQRARRGGAVVAEDEAALVARTRAGDPNAFERLVERHSALVRSLAALYVGSGDAAANAANAAKLLAPRVGITVAGIIPNIGGRNVSDCHERRATALIATWRSSTGCCTREPSSRSLQEPGPGGGRAQLCDRGHPSPAQPPALQHKGASLAVTVRRRRARPHHHQPCPRVERVCTCRPLHGDQRPAGRRSPRRGGPAGKRPGRWRRGRGPARTTPDQRVPVPTRGATHRSRAGRSR